MLKFLRNKYKEYMLDHFPMAYMDRQWIRRKGYKIDWDHPRDINEKIQWLMFCSDTSPWTRCADKLAVRDFVKERGLGELLPELYGSWGTTEEIDWEGLPRKFVLKCNHDSGSTQIVDKALWGKGNSRQKEEICSELRGNLNRKFGYLNNEIYYNAIPPRVFAEQYLDYGLAAPPDYKVWCFSGEPYAIWACYGRGKDEVRVNLYDLNWQVHPEVSVFTEHYKDGGGTLPRPRGLEQMLTAAAALSAGFPEVRVDFYDIDGRVYFGEMTFSSLGGQMNYFTDDFLRVLGDKCKLPR